MRRWRPRTRRTSAILMPSGAAGAIFLLSSGVFALLDSNATKTFSPEVLAIAFVALMFATPIGFLLAGLPMFFGVMSMHWLGNWNLGLRHPATWGMAGGGLAATLVLAAPDNIFDGGYGTAPGLVATATLCALLARSYVRWPGKEEWQ